MATTTLNSDPTSSSNQAPVPADDGAAIVVLDVEDDVEEAVTATATDANAAGDVVTVNGFVPEREEAFLFDAQLLKQLDFSQSLAQFRPAVTPQEPGHGLRVRPLGTADHQRGFLQLLTHLTKVGDISEAAFLKRFSAMKSCNGTYYVTVIEDLDKNTIIGAATLVVERKFIRECAKKGIIEDVVVSNEYRGKQLGKLIVATLVELAKSLGCYKISLNCTDQMIKFYGGLGFTQEEGNANFLQIRV